MGNKRPYSIDDRVDFFIFEIADEKYQDNFFIIPKKVLIELKYISTANNNGKCGINIPVSSDYHWTRLYLNRVDQLTANVDIPLVFNNLHKICLDKGFQCGFDKRKIASINSLKVLHISSLKYNNKSYIFGLTIQRNGQKSIININDDYLFVIFESSITNQFWIVPMYVLIKCGHIATNKNDGKWAVCIPYTGLETNDWIEFYNNFDQLKNISNSPFIS